VFPSENFSTLEWRFFYIVVLNPGVDLRYYLLFEKLAALGYVCNVIFVVC
jgi:hypothetical protein